jgi:hypothetical protein
MKTPYNNFMATSYETVRQKYKPQHIKFLLIAESPPPPPDIQSSRQFYYTDRIRRDDRLFTNTIRALYPQTAELKEVDLEQDKEKWLNRLKTDGWYMIEALEESQQHKVTKGDRQAKIAQALPSLLERVKQLAQQDTKIILIKSNVFDVAAGPLVQAGYDVLNTELVDYPGHFNQKAYREKLRKLSRQS